MIVKHHGVPYDYIEAIYRGKKHPYILQHLRT